MIAYTASVWTQVIVAVSIFVPVLVTVGITWAFMRSARNDPDEQRRRRMDADRRATNAAESRRDPT